MSDIQLTVSSEHLQALFSKPKSPSICKRSPMSAPSSARATAMAPARADSPPESALSTSSFLKSAMVRLRQRCSCGINAVNKPCYWR